MAQRRNSSGREDDLSDVKALAAKARETGGPVLKPNAAELSGVRPRRDSVIGMRLTPPPRAPSSELPNWFWGVLGCLSVLLVGFAGLFFLGRSGKLAPLLGDALVATAPVTAPVAPAPPAPSVATEPAAPAPAERPGAAEHAAHLEHQHAHVAVAAPSSAAAERAAPAVPEAAPAAPPTDNSAPVAADDGAKRATRAPKAKAGKEGEPPAASTTTTAPAETRPRPRPRRRDRHVPRRPRPRPAPTTPDDDPQSSLPGQDDVERALDGLAPRVRGCFVKYQIKGTARVRLVATPAGKAESVNVTGDFEDTPTGLCVESVLTDAKLPTFKGPPLKLSQSYQLR